MCLIILKNKLPGLQIYVQLSIDILFNFYELWILCMCFEQLRNILLNDFHHSG